MNELAVVDKGADWRRLKSLVLDSVSSPITKRVYNLGLDEFFAWYAQEPRPGFTKATVAARRVARPRDRFHPCTWQETPLGQLQALPRDEEALTEHRDRDQAWSELTQEVRKIVRDLNRLPPRPSASAGAA